MIRPLGGIALGVLALVGCYSQERYVVRAADLVAAGQADPPSALVPAIRQHDGVRVALVPRAVRGVVVPDGADQVIVRTHEYSQDITDGSVLTWVGTAMSLFGSAGFVATYNDRSVFTYGALSTELLSEPVMITGTLLWIRGLKRPPLERAPATIPPPAP